MAQRNAKPGPYPNADRSNIFGTLFLQFHQSDGKLRSQAFNGMRGIVRSIARRRKDAAFLEMYQRFTKDGVVDEMEMETLVDEMWRVMDDASTWDYTGAEFLEDEEEVNVDLVTA